MLVKWEKFIQDDSSKSINSVARLNTSTHLIMISQWKNAPFVPPVIQKNCVKNQECTFCPIVDIPMSVKVTERTYNQDL